MHDRRDGDGAAVTRTAGKSIEIVQATSYEAVAAGATGTVVPVDRSAAAAPAGKAGATPAAPAARVIIDRARAAGTTDEQGRRIATGLRADTLVVAGIPTEQ